MNDHAKKASLLSLIGVASVWFGNHAGGGFASGNQATQYFVHLGWTSAIMPFITIAIMALTLREAIIMANCHGFLTYKELFRELYSPYSKLEIVFEIYFYLILLSAVGAAIAGAATLFEDLGTPYAVAVLIVGVILFFLTIFGAKLVTKAQTILSVVILVSCAIIFATGIAARSGVLGTILVERQSTSAVGFTDHSIWQPIWNSLTYGGFQYSVLPAFVSCAAFIKRPKDATKAAFLGFLMNGLALGASCWMLLGWYQEYSLDASGSTLPTLFICKQIGIPALQYLYTIALFACFVSTGVSVVYGFITRFEKETFIAKKISNLSVRRGILSLGSMAFCMAFSLMGLNNVVKYGYGLCGIIGVFVVTIPFLTIGAAKNRKYLKEHANDVPKD